MPSKKDVAKKKAKASIENPSGLYEFANDQLGENKDAAFKDLNTKASNSQMCNKKKK